MEPSVRFPGVVVQIPQIPVSPARLAALGMKELRAAGFGAEVLADLVYAVTQPETYEEALQVLMTWVEVELYSPTTQTHP